MITKIDYEMMARLGELYKKYKRDFHLRVDYDLTEPTCPTVTIFDDDSEIIARTDSETIEEGINAAMKIACDRLLDGKGGDIWPDAMGTNPNSMKNSSKYPI